MRVVALVGDLIALSRIDAAARAAGAAVTAIREPAELPPPDAVDLVVVDWGDRQPGWGSTLAGWRAGAGSRSPRLVLFGPHVDLAAHAEARQHGIGPVLGRGKLFSALPRLFRPPPAEGAGHRTGAGCEPRRPDAARQPR